MPIHGPRLRFVSKNIHFLDCNCDCDKRRLELQKVLDIVHLPGLVCESRTFNSTGGTPSAVVKYSEYRAIGHPKSLHNGEFGSVGDIFIDITPLNHKLYAKMSLHQWTVWPGPLIVLNSLRHPLFPRQTLSFWLEGKTGMSIGWAPKYSKLKDYSTPVHDIIAACLASPKPSKNTLKRKRLPESDRNDGPQTKKVRRPPESVSGGHSSTTMSSSNDGILPTTMLNPPDSTTGETIPYVPQPSSHQDFSLDGTPNLPAPSPVSDITMSHLKSPVSNAPTIPPQPPPGTNGVQLPQVPVPVDANVDAPLGADLTSSNGVDASLDMANQATDTPPPPIQNEIENINVHTPPSPELPQVSVHEDANVNTPVHADHTSSNDFGVMLDIANEPIDPLPPTWNGMEDINGQSSPSPELSVSLEPRFIPSNPSTITSQPPNEPFSRSDAADSDPILDTVRDHPTAARPNNPSDFVLSTPNLSEPPVGRESPIECIGGESSVSESQSDNASRPTSRARNSPELGLVSAAPNPSLVNDTPSLPMAIPAPSSGGSDDPDQPAVTPQRELVSSEVIDQPGSSDAEGIIRQPELTPNIDAVGRAGMDEVNLEGDDPPVPMSMSKASGDSLSENNADDEEEGNSSFLVLCGGSLTMYPLKQKVEELEGYIEDIPFQGLLPDEVCEPPTLFGDSPATSPLEQKVVELVVEDPPIQGLLPDEVCERPRRDSISGPSISPATVGNDADMGKNLREVVRSSQASAGDGPKACPLRIDSERRCIEVIYHRSETQTDLMCRLCLGSSLEHVTIFSGDTPWHVLAGHCREDHPEYYALLVDLDVDQLQAIRTCMDGFVS
ncbi:hypothetical protein M413DRAFT_444385 [Hebeloma cylindrosporum]|uniref:Uncharacterized protein n=1 Tax=Hebeloma cylindrosporum TaxID=76867 RepID=A0A0C2XYL7_HEBCY|nr:hypothetical protein M413DRAFT_444385 [Hebeloma cylindrosporum h7]